MTITTVVNLPIQNRAAGTRTFDDPQPVPANLFYATLELPMNTADKLAVGNQLTASFFFSSDGGTTYSFANSTDWVSYGPNGYTVTDPDGTVRTNPNPRIIVPVADKAGQRLRAVAILPQSLALGVLITTTGP